MKHLLFLGLVEAVVLVPAVEPPPVKQPPPVKGHTPAPTPRVVETVPPGYPPPPAGFRWERYPDGRWGLVQNGVRLPTTSPAKATPVTYTPVSPVLCGPTG